MSPISTNYNILPLILFFSLAGGVNSLAQQSANASGGDASGVGGSAAYTIGQVAYSFQTDTSGEVNQGVQQPYEIHSVGIEKKGLLSMDVYPNPTSDQLTLELEKQTEVQIRYKVLSLQGKTVMEQPITKPKEQLSLGSLPTGTYFLVLIKEGKRLNTFKIIKN